jgi:hypothetical protein
MGSNIWALRFIVISKIYNGPLVLGPIFFLKGNAVGEAPT